ncbi:MAG TPA: hypothetical protein VJ508_08215, partial [Saprospiraceae bacterium]|nr:hypothetical protein [Saprospiraceae bacterium]
MKQHNGMMRVTGPFRCLDSMNFTVQPQRPMPFNCMMGDTVWMRVCLRAHDGKLHQTTIYYGTDQGTVSFEVAMQAAGTSIVPINLAPRITMALYPNPTMDRVFINLSDVLPEPMTIEIVDLKG